MARRRHRRKGEAAAGALSNHCTAEGRRLINLSEDYRLYKYADEQVFRWGRTSYQKLRLTGQPLKKLHSLHAIFDVGFPTLLRAKIRMPEAIQIHLSMTIRLRQKVGTAGCYQGDDQKKRQHAWLIDQLRKVQASFVALDQEFWRQQQRRDPFATNNPFGPLQKPFVDLAGFSLFPETRLAEREETDLAPAALLVIDAVFDSMILASTGRLVFSDERIDTPMVETCSDDPNASGALEAYQVEIYNDDAADIDDNATERGDDTLLLDQSLLTKEAMDAEAACFARSLAHMEFSEIRNPVYVEF